jgi:DNA mismatch repair protein MLH1
VRLPPRHVDVNVHPTKREVAFLHQDALIEAVRGAAEAALLTSNAQRTFTQARLPGAPPPPLPPADLAAGGGGEAAAAGQSSYYRPDRLVRTDARAQTLHAFLGAATQQAAAAGQEAGGSAGGAAAEDLEQAGAAAMETDDVQRVEGAGGSEEAPRGAAATAAAAAAAAAAAQPAARRRRGGGGGAAALGGDDEFAFMPTAMEIAGAGAAAAQIQTQPATQTLGRPVRHRLNPAHAAGLGLASVEALLAEAERSPHSGLADILRAPTFVGMADCRRALLQAGTRLYLADLTALSHDMFYQQALRRFAQAPRLRLRPAPSVRALAAAALEAEAAAGRWRDSAEGGTREEVAGLLEALLLKKAAVLRECFGVEVDEGGRLAALPQLIEQYAPHPCRLPAFLLALGQGVEWGEERACFRGVALALAALFQVQPDPGEEEEEEEEWAAAAAAAGDRDGAGEAGGGGGGAPPAARPEREAARRRREWAVEHVVLPALRLFLTPGRGRAGDGSVVELTRLEQLYRVFERC